MTKIDKNIIKFIMITIVVVLTSCLISNFYATIKGFSIVLTGLYFFFITCHIILCFPTIAIVVMVVDFLNWKIGLERIKEYSEILFYLIHIFFIVVALITVYYFVPILIAMMYNGSIDFKEAQKLIDEFNRLK